MVHSKVIDSFGLKVIIINFNPDKDMASNLLVASYLAMASNPNLIILDLTLNFLLNINLM